MLSFFNFLNFEIILNNIQRSIQYEGDHIIKDEKYFKEFGKFFRNSIERLIKEETERTASLSNQNDFLQEIIHHASRANNLAKKMPDQNNQYGLINRYLADDNNTSPFILTGSSGAGKSSLMAFVAKKVSKLYSIRF